MTEAIAGSRFVGRSVHRVDDDRLVSGGGRYVADVQLRGELHACFVRSEHAHARILGIRTAAAEGAEGVIAVLTGRELNSFVAGDMHATEYLGHAAHAPLVPLVTDMVRFVGEPVAIVVARDRYLAEDAAELVEVDYEVLTPVLDYERAVDDLEHLVWTERGTNIAERVGRPIDVELQQVLDNAPHVITKTFRQHRQTPAPLETRGVIAEWTAQELRVHISSQFPFEVRAVVSRITGIPMHRVRVLIGDVGGGFGQKAYMPHDEQVVVIAAVYLQRTVKWIEDRHENLIASTQSRHEQMTVTFAVDDDGVLLGAHVDHMADIGAHPVFTTGGGAVFVCMIFPGPYRIPRFAYRSTSVFTNTCSRGAYRGPWQVESVAREAMMDCVARELCIDPLEIRRRNVLHEEDLPYASPGGMLIRAVSPAASLEHAAELIDEPAFRLRQHAALATGRLLGLGIALYIEPQPGSQHSTDGVTLKVTTTGMVEVAQASGDHGQGLTTTTAQLVADTLGVDVADVVVRQGDTALAPFGGGTGGSRSGPMLGAAVLEASGKLRDLILEHAAERLEAAPADLMIEAGVISVRGTPTASVTLADLARDAHRSAGSSDLARGLSIVNHFRPPVAFTYSNACHVCTVEVDRATGVTTILRYVVSEDCGNVINPAIVDGQIAGGVAQGIGGALYEHVRYDDIGNPLTSTFMDYLMPTIGEVPIIEIEHRPTPGVTPGGFKGVGEGGVIGAVPAVLNAVADALASIGAEITDQPLTPPRLLAAMRSHALGRPATDD